MSDLRFCPACGAQLPRVAGVPVRFCPGCGVRLEGVVGYPGAVGATDGATADDDAGEGGDSSVDAPADAPVETAGVASSSRDATTTDAPRIGDLELHAACDASGGQALAQVALPRGWHIEEAHLERSGSFDCPISVGVTAAGAMGERIVYRSELCYVDAGAVAKRIPTQTERKVFVHVEAACDELAQACAARLGARAEVVAEQPYPSSAEVDIERERARVKREAANDFAIQGFSMEPSDVVYECRMRRYRLTGAPVPTELAVAAKVEGYMFSIGGVAGSMGKGVAAGAEALLGAGLSSGLIGGVLGKRFASARRRQRRDRASRKNSPRVEAVARTEHRSSWVRPTCCSGVSGTASVWLRQKVAWTRRPPRRLHQWRRLCGSIRRLHAKRQLKSNRWCLSSANARR